MADHRIIPDRAVENSMPSTNPAQAFLPKLVQRTEFWLAVLLTAGLSVLHIVRALRLGALWRDEVGTVSIALKPSFSQMWSNLPYDAFPLLPYLGVRFWSSLIGGSDASLRVLGCLIALGIIAALWLNHRALGLYAPFFSLIFFAFNPTVIQYGAMLRGYGLGTLLILITYGAVWNVVESPSKVRVLFAAMAAILSVQSLYQNAMLLFAICLGGFCCCIRDKNRKTAIAILCIGAAAAATLIPYYSTIRSGQQVLLIHGTDVPYSQLLGLGSLVLGSGSRLLLAIWMVCIGVGVATAFLLLIGAHSAAGDRRVDRTIYGLVTLFAGGGLFLVFLRTTHLAPSPWYFIVGVGFVGLSLDVVLQNSIPGGTGRLLVVLLGVVAIGLTIPILPRWTTPKYTNIDLVVSRLNELTAKGDLIVVSPFYYGITLQRYYRGPAASITVPPIEDLELTRLDLVKSQMAKENPLQPVFDRIESTLQSGQAVWVVGSIGLPPAGEQPQIVPPAPGGPHGWWAADYYRSWPVQLGYFMRSHATEVRQVAVPTDPSTFGIFENPSALRFLGFKPGTP